MLRNCGRLLLAADGPFGNLCRTIYAGRYFHCRPTSPVPDALKQLPERDDRSRRLHVIIYIDFFVIALIDLFYVPLLLPLAFALSSLFCSVFVLD